MNSSEASAQPKAPHVVSGERESNLFIPSLFVQSSVHSVFHAFCVISAVLHSAYQKCVCVRVWILGVVFSIVVVLFLRAGDVR